MADDSYSNSGQAFEADLNQVNLPDGPPENASTSDEEEENDE